MIDKIFLDMDGVIVDFIGQCKKYKCISGNKVNWEIIDSAGAEFWETMDWLPDGKNFFSWLTNICNEENIDLYILSSAKSSSKINADVTPIKIGKLNWLKQHTKIDLHHILLVNDGNEKGILYANATSLLIDDFNKNCENFKNHGGQAIKYTILDTVKEEIIKALSTR